MIAALLLAAGTALGGFADLDAVDRQVAVFTGFPVGAVGGAATPVDRRLKLRPCRTGLALSWRSAAQDSVLVQCGDPDGWRLFVPVRRGGPAAPDAPAALAVKRGDAVSIAVEGDGFSVSQPGEALESGAIGAWIRVRPVVVGKGRPAEMHAQIVRPGLVSLQVP